MPVPRGFTDRVGAFGTEWKPKIGESLLGKVVSYRVQVGPNHQDCCTVVDADTGELHAVWISANLTGRITPEDIGRAVYIERLHDSLEGKAGRSPMKTFDVGVK